MLRRTLVPDGPAGRSAFARRAAARGAKEPLIEVDLSNIYRAETFRQHSHVFLAANGVICGSGPRGHVMALDALAAL
jgi:3-dehydroquinate dehydratase II